MIHCHRSSCKLLCSVSYIHLTLASCVLQAAWRFLHNKLKVSIWWDGHHCSKQELRCSELQTGPNSEKNGRAVCGNVIDSILSCLTLPFSQTPSLQCFPQLLQCSTVSLQKKNSNRNRERATASFPVSCSWYTFSSCVAQALLNNILLSLIPIVLKIFIFHESSLFLSLSLLEPQRPTITASLRPKGTLIFVVFCVQQLLLSSTSVTSKRVLSRFSIKVCFVSFGGSDKSGTVMLQFLAHICQV